MLIKIIKKIKNFKNYNNNEAINIVKKLIKFQLMKTKRNYYRKKIITIKIKEFIKSNINQLNKILKKKITNLNFSNFLNLRIILRKQFRQFIFINNIRKALFQKRFISLFERNLRRFY